MGGVQSFSDLLDILLLIWINQEQIRVNVCETGAKRIYRGTNKEFFPVSRRLFHTTKRIQLRSFKNLVRKTNGSKGVSIGWVWGVRILCHPRQSIASAYMTSKMKLPQLPRIFQELRSGIEVFWLNLISLMALLSHFTNFKILFSWIGSCPSSSMARVST